MREIKFRAWMPYNEDPNDMRMEYYPQLFAEDGNGIFNINSVFAHPIDYFAENGTYPEAVIKFMQYTGLHDNNGREIYEGDIVRLQETMDGGRIVCLEAIASVIWNGERGCWGCDGEFEGHLADYAFGTVLNFMGNVCEVVGNIYENPELLEGEK